MQPPAHLGEIVVVEDPMIQKLVHGILARHGYPVTGLSVTQVLERVQREDSDFILITNNPTPFLDLADTIPLLYISVMPDPELAERFAYCRCLPKPFHPQALVETISELRAAAVL